MFDSDLILLKGDRESGKSTFAFDFSKYIHSSGMKVCYVRCSENINYMDKHFDLVKSLTQTDYNNDKTIQVINEIVTKEKFDYLIVDDIDFLTKKCIESLSKINVKKVFTFTEFIVIEMPSVLRKVEPIIMTSTYNESVRTFYLQSSNINEEFRNVSDFLKEKIRDKKLNTILNEK